MTQYGRLHVQRHSTAIGFTIGHEMLRREALLSADEVRGLAGELGRMLMALSTEDASGAEDTLLKDLLS